jgi:uncharacterized membrane protein
MQTRWFSRVTYLYLLLPFMIFCMGWLRLSIAIPVTAIILWAGWQLLKQDSPVQFSGLNSRSVFILLVITGLWIFFSGVGGYAFQNWDHHWRNAVLHDLITYDWPVVYSSSDKGPINVLVYYVGYWLPSALAGKLFGWKFANFILFLWTWLGVVLTILHLNLKLKTTLFKTVFLLIFFSGMDALGALFFAKDYPTLWPPIQHLEIWSGSLQYSSFTTQLFWVFNQAVPAWLCIALILESDSLLSDRQGQALQITQKIFIWSLCFFFAPLASIGLFPYLIIEFIKRTDFKNPLKNIRFDLLLASLIIVIISYLFFSSNTAAQERGFQSVALKDFLVFFLLEGGILWLLLAPRLWRDPRWAVTGLLLFCIPFIQFGSGRDFVMRASIAPLMYLMIMVGETIFQKTTKRILLFSFYLLLLLGSFTPLYEINRSVYRTFEYYFLLDKSQRAQPTSEIVTHLEQPGAPENEHPNMLVADEIQTLKFMTDQLSKNFIANVRQSLYYHYLSPH